MQFIGYGIFSLLSLGIIFLNTSHDPAVYGGLAGVWNLGLWNLKMQVQILTPHVVLGDPGDTTAPP